jgi:hypothetical protein
VTSTERDGTTFTVRLPRRRGVGAGQSILDEEHILRM